MTTREIQRANYLETKHFFEHHFALDKEQFLHAMEAPFGFYGNDLETLEEFIIENIGNIRFGWKVLADGSTYKLIKKH